MVFRKAANKILPSTPRDEDEIEEVGVSSLTGKYASMLTVLSIIFIGWGYYQVMIDQTLSTLSISLYLSAIMIIHMSLTGRIYVRFITTLLAFIPASLFLIFISGFYISDVFSIILSTEAFIGPYFSTILFLACIVFVMYGYYKFVYWYWRLHLFISREIYYRINNSDPMFSLTQKGLGRTISDKGWRKIKNNK